MNNSTCVVYKDVLPVVHIIFYATQPCYGHFKPILRVVSLRLLTVKVVYGGGTSFPEKN